MNSPMGRLQLSYTGARKRLDLWVRQIPGGAALLDAWAAYTRDEMGILAAGLAYYFLLTLFPLLLLLIALASPFLQSEEVVRQASRFIGSYLPSVGPEIRNVLNQALSARGPATFAAALGLLWSASGVFDVLQRGLDRAWHVPAPRSLWRQRLISFAMVLLLGAFFGLSFASSAITRGIHLRLAIGSVSVEVLGSGLTLMLIFMLFTIIYRVFPNRSLSLRQVWIGALVAAVLWEGAKYIFVWYLIDIARLSIIYGSVGVILGLLTWGYITAAIILFGAELAAIEIRRGET